MDYDSHVRLVLAGSRADLNFEPLAVIRVRDDSLSRQGTAGLEGLVAVLSKVVARTDLSPAEEAVGEHHPDARARCQWVAGTGGQQGVIRLGRRLGCGAVAGGEGCSPALAGLTAAADEVRPISRDPGYHT